MTAVTGGRVHRGFGLEFSCDFELPGLPTVPGGKARDVVRMRLATPAEIDAAWSGPEGGARPVETRLDGLRCITERGTAGDHRFTYGEGALFHVSADSRTLLCAPEDADAPEWRRVLLDSVLGLVSLLHGYEALHAAAVMSPTGVVAFMGHTGGGKTTLVVELLRRGFPLMSDDVLALSREDGRIAAHPAPPVMNLPAGTEWPDGQALATIAGETWFAARHAAAGPAPLAAVCLIDRRPGSVPGVVPGPASPLDLIVHGLGSGSAPERRKSRFELLSDLAAQAPAYVLEADTRTGAGELADLLEAAVPALQQSRAEVSR